MKDALVAIALVVLALPAHAQLYRCQNGGTIVFSESPCAPNAVRKELDGQAPSAADAEAARKRAAQARGDAEAIDKALEARQKSAPPPPPAASPDKLARLCVDRYRPHLAYPDGVRIDGQRIETDGFGRTIYVNVRTITNPATPARIDPVVLGERFICRLTPQDGIDERYTEDYVNRHKGGQHL